MANSFCVKMFALLSCNLINAFAYFFARRWSDFKSLLLCPCMRMMFQCRFKQHRHHGLIYTYA